MLMKEEGRVYRDDMVGIKKVESRRSCSRMPQKVMRLPSGWPPIEVNEEEKEGVMLSEEALFAATSNYYIGVKLQEWRAQEEVAAEWRMQCQCPHGQAVKSQEGVEIAVRGRVLRKRRIRKLKKRQDQAQEVWGKNLLRNPRAQNDCFFEAISWGLESLGIVKQAQPKRMRNMLASAHKKGPYHRLQKIARAEDLSPAEYCRSLRQRLWGGFPEAELIAEKYGVVICTWSAEGRILYQVGQSLSAIHLGLHQSHYVLLSRGYGPVEGSRESQAGARGGAKGSEEKTQKKGKKEEDKRVKKIEKTAKRLSKAVKEDLAKEAKDKEKRRVRLKAVALQIESDFDALRAEIGSGGATSSCQPPPPVEQQDHSDLQDVFDVFAPGAQSKSAAKPKSEAGWARPSASDSTAPHLLEVKEEEPEELKAAAENQEGVEQDETPAPTEQPEDLSQAEKKERKEERRKGKKRRRAQSDDDGEEASSRIRNAGADLHREEPEAQAPPAPKEPKEKKSRGKERKKGKEKEEKKEAENVANKGMSGSDRGPGWAKVDRRTASWLLRLSWGKERYERGVYCYLCHKWCTKAHLESKDHKRRIVNSGPRIQQTTGPPVLHDLPGRLLSEVIDEFSEGESTWIEEEEEEKDDDEERQREEKKKEKKSKKKREVVHPRDQDPPAQRGGSCLTGKGEESEDEAFIMENLAPWSQQEIWKDEANQDGKKESKPTFDRRAVSRLEGKLCSATRQIEADCDGWCQFVLESYKQQQSILVGVMVATCVDGDCYATPLGILRGSRGRAESNETKVRLQEEHNPTTRRGGMHQPREESGRELLMRAEAQTRESLRWLNALLESLHRIRERSRTPPRGWDVAQNIVARGEEEDQGAVAAEVGEQPRGEQEELPREPEEEAPNLADFRRDEGDQGNEEADVVVIPDEEEPPGVLLYPLTIQSAPAGRRSYEIGYLNPVDSSIADLHFEWARVARRGALTFQLCFWGAPLEGWRCLNNVPVGSRIEAWAWYDDGGEEPLSSLRVQRRPRGKGRGREGGRRPGEGVHPPWRGGSPSQIRYRILKKAQSAPKVIPRVQDLVSALAVEAHEELHSLTGDPSKISEGLLLLASKKGLTLGGTRGGRGPPSAWTHCIKPTPGNFRGLRKAPSPTMLLTPGRGELLGLRSAS